MATTIQFHTLLLKSSIFSSSTYRKKCLKNSVKWWSYRKMAGSHRNSSFPRTFWHTGYEDPMKQWLGQSVKIRISAKFYRANLGTAQKNSGLEAISKFLLSTYPVLLQMIQYCCNLSSIVATEIVFSQKAQILFKLCQGHTTDDPRWKASYNHGSNVHQSHQIFSCPLLLVTLSQNLEKASSIVAIEIFYWKKCHMMLDFSLN